MKRFFNWAKRSSSPNDSNGSSNRSLSHENSSMESTPYDNYPSASSSPSSSPMEESREAETAASSSSPSSSSAVASSPLHLRALLCPTTTTTGGAAALPSSPLLSREKNGTMEHHHSNFNSGSPPATSLAEEAEEEEEEEGEEEEGFFNHKDKKRLKRGVAPPSTNSAFHHFHHLLLQEEAEEGEASSYGFTSMMETTSVAGGLGGVASFDGSFFPFTQLPTELQLKTIQHVFTLRDVCAVRGTCWHFHALAQHNTVWRTLARRRFCIPKSRVRWYKHLDWQAYFRQYLLFQQPGILRWEKVRITGEATRPCARYAHTGAAIGTDIYYIGGQNLSGARLAEIYRYDTVQREFHQVTLRNGKVPNFARHQSVCIDGLIYSFGGFDLEVFYNVAVFDPKQRSWSYPVCKGQIPPPRSNHSSAVIGNCFYIFGGSVGDNVNKYEIIGDFYCLNTETMVWKKIEAKGAPSRRVGHKMVSVGDEIFLFGGGLWSAQEGWTTQYNDIYFYTAGTFCRQSPCLVSLIEY
ncbi:Kelch repeat protein, variant 2 [Balamuthia mandrillaris]